MANQSDLKILREQQAKKYHEFKKIEEEKIRLENEEILLKEMEYRENFDNFLSEVNNHSLVIQRATNIYEIETRVSYVYSLLENKKDYLKDDILKKEIQEKIYHIINSISMNPNAKFNVNENSDTVTASKMIVQTMKLIMDLCGVEDTEVSIETMDTENDAEIAQKLQTEQISEAEIQWPPVTYHFPISPNIGGRRK